MKQSEYHDACARREHKDLPVEVKNLKTGEVGTVVQCSDWGLPEGLLVRVGDELTTWYPEDVREVTEES